MGVFLSLYKGLSAYVMDSRFNLQAVCEFLREYLSQFCMMLQCTTASHKSCGISRPSLPEQCVIISYSNTCYADLQLKNEI